MRRVLSLLPRIAALVAGISLLGVAANAVAQNDEALPPHVIDVWPYPGEEVPVDEAVTVTFDQPVNAASVEAAWQTDPATPGAFTWTDERTVQFAPDGGWPRATRIDVTIGTGATAANGLTLEDPYTFFVQTIGYLEVSAVIPAAGAEGVTADATITVSFDRPVVPLLSTEQLDDLPDPLAFDPAVEGAGEWVNTSIYQFTPAVPLKGGTTYTVTVPAGLEDVTGATLQDAYTWQFKTLAPEILNITPRQGETDVLLDAPVTVQFSQPMDRPSTEEAFLLLHDGERVPGAFEWSDDNRTLTLKPDALFDIESVYSLSIADSARSASGEATISQGVTYTFTTVKRPGIDSTYPANNEQGVQPGGGVSITFRSPMNMDTLEGKVEIVQPEGVEWMPIVQGDRTLYMDFALLPETTYAITVKAGAEDLYGNAIETDYTFTFTTAALEPYASLPAQGQFMITNAYREDTRIAMSVTARPEVKFTLYRAGTDDLADLTRGYYYYDERPPVARDENLVRKWTQRLDPGATPWGVDEVLLASDEGGQLPTGVYLLEADVPNQDYPQYMALAVVTADLTVKRGPDEALIWATDMNSADPVAGLPVTIYGAGGVELASGQTGDDGMFRAPVDLSGASDQSLYAVAQSDAAYGVWNSWSQPYSMNTATYLYTDRPIYRPGQTVYFRGALRDRDDVTYTRPATEQVRVVIDVNYGSQILYEGDLTLTEFGTFDGKVDLPEDAQIGQGTIYMSVNGETLGQIGFTIAEFRTPEYKVEVTPDYDSIIQGDPLNAVAAASYYFGGAVSDASLTWTAHGEPAYFNYTGPGRYSFTDYDQDYFSWVDLGSGTEQTDANGQVIVTLENTTAPTTRPMNIIVEGEVYDESGQYIAGRTSVLAHPAEVYVGLRTDRYFGREGQPVGVDLIAVTPDSAPITGQKIAVTVIEKRWERTPIEGQFGQYTWTQTEIDVQTDEIVTGEDGTASYSFTPPNAGIFQIRAQVRDGRERLNTASTQIWVTGSSRTVWWGQPSSQIDLVADKELYNVGDTAQILVPIPFSGASTALVTIERDGVQSYEVRQVEGSTLIYELPISEEHVPTIFVSVVVVKGVDEESANPDYRSGTIGLEVDPASRRLNVTVTPSATMAQPGDTVTFDVKTTDAHGEPVSAEVGLTLTDQAILSLAPPNSISLEDTFYGYQSDAVYTTVALDSLLDSMTDEILEQQKQRDAAAGAVPMAAMPTATAMNADGMVMEAAAEAFGAEDEAAQQQVEIREDFQQTPLWAPRVVTDETGSATVEVTLPDNLTTWHLDARGLTPDTLVGDAGLDVMSTLPLLVRPVTPRFMVVGDRVTLASVINNNTSAAQTVQATLQSTGITLESDATQSVTIEAGSRARVEWVAVVEDVSAVDLTFIAIGADGYQDASKPTLATGPDGTIPVYRYTAPDTVGTGGVLREDGSRTEAISLPPRLDADQGELTVQLDPSLAATTIDALNYLKNYQHQCIEQTVSRFLPNVMTYRALRDLGIDDPALEESLKAALDHALTKLAAEQNPDGGWGWFTGMESNPYITSYAALGLIEARDAGFAVDTSMLDRALNFVRGDFIRPVIDTPAWQLNRQAFYLYVFARNGESVLNEMDALLAQRLEMDFWARGFLLMAYHQLDPGNAAVASLVSDLQSGAIVSATGAHWEEADMDWWNWSSDTRSTAIVMAALTRVTPDYDLLPNVVRWLMVARNGDHWETTQETAWAVMGLTDWMKASGELEGNYDYAVTLNGDLRTEGTVTPETVRDGQTLQVAVKDLLLDEANRLTVIRGEGDGVLYYTAHLSLRLLASEAEPISRGITVSREYFGEDDPTAPIAQAQVGDLITVRVTMTLPQDVYYFVLEDPLPAGTEPVDTSLLTTTQNAQGPSIRPDYDPHWFWGWWLFDHTEMRDEQVNLYADFLPRGTYVYTYQVRASVPGEFQTMPSHAYAFYFPEVFGRGAGTLFTVTSADGE